MWQVKFFFSGNQVTIFVILIYLRWLSNIYFYITLVEKDFVTVTQINLFIMAAPMAYGHMELSPSHSCDLCCTCDNTRSYNPLGRSRDRTSSATETSQIVNQLHHRRNSIFFTFYHEKVYPWIEIKQYFFPISLCIQTHAFNFTSFMLWNQFKFSVFLLDSSWELVLIASELPISSVFSSLWCGIARSIVICFLLPLGPLSLAIATGWEWWNSDDTQAGHEGPPSWEEAGNGLCHCQPLGVSSVPFLCTQAQGLPLGGRGLGQARSRDWPGGEALP